jgi:hypothetical protein
MNIMPPVTPRGVQNLNSVNALLQTAQTGPQTPAQPQPLKRRYEQSQFRLSSGSGTRQEDDNLNAQVELPVRNRDVDNMC